MFGARDFTGFDSRTGTTIRVFDWNIRNRSRTIFLPYSIYRYQFAVNAFRNNFRIHKDQTEFWIWWELFLAFHSERLEGSFSWDISRGWIPQMMYFCYLELLPMIFELVVEQDKNCDDKNLRQKKDKNGENFDVVFDIEIYGFYTYHSICYCYSIFSNSKISCLVAPNPCADQILMRKPVRPSNSCWTRAPIKHP